jgi:hypothetical protein
MSDYRAIGGVSSTLQALLRDRMELPLAQFPSVSNVQVTVGAPPEADPTGTAAEPARVNLFLYRVTESTALKNSEIPGHGTPGAFGHPPLSLELHYLLTAYGTTTDGDFPSDSKLAHHLLGNAMRVLHDFPIIPPQLNRQTVPPVGTPILDSSLLDEFERVKLCLDPVSLDDLAKVWTALEQPFRVAAAYSVNVVQIESRQPRRAPRPVGEPPAAGPRVFAVPMRGPGIDAILVRRFDDPSGAEHPYAYARIGDTLILRGSGFGTAAANVILGGLSIPIAPSSPERIEVVVPDADIGGVPIPPEHRLMPGVQTVSMVVGVPGLPQTGFPSNQAAFMLVPFVGALLPALAAVPRTLTIQGNRLYSPQLAGEALVGRASIPRDEYATPTDTQVTVALPDALPAGSVICVVSGNPQPFSTLAGSATLDVQIGADGPRTIGFSRPVSIDDAAAKLRAAIRAAAGAGPGFTGARVGIASEPATQRLVLIAGGLRDTVAVTPSGGDPAAGQLGLTSGQVSQITGYLSGPLAPFPRLSGPQPRFTLTIGGSSAVVALTAPPTTIEAAAPWLQAAIRGAGTTAAFTAARVVPLDSQLLILPGAAQPVTAGPVAGVDSTTVSELQLKASYLVRIRVNGAESIDGRALLLP